MIKGSDREINSFRILFFCAETYPPPYALLQKVFNELLWEHGFHTVWVMPSTKVGRIEETDWDENPVILIPKIRPKGMTDLVSAYWRHLRCVEAASRLALKRYGPFHLVQVRDDPAMAYVAWRLAKRLKVPFVYQVSHLKEEEVIMYAQMRIYGSPLKNRLQGKVGFAIRNLLLKRANLVFPISEQMKRTLAHYGVLSSRMVVLPEGVDASIDPKSFDDEAWTIRNELGLQDKKVITYVGTMSRFRQLDFLLEALKLVLRSHPEVHLLMVGAGKEPQDLEWLKSRASELGIEQNMTFTGWIPREAVPAYIRASDIGVSPIVPNRVYENSSPIKILEYFALEIPVVATDIPEQRAIIEQSGGGVCTPWDVRKFAEAVNGLLSLTAMERRNMGKVGQRWVKEHRDFSVLSQIVLESFNNFMHKR